MRTYVNIKGQGHSLTFVQGHSDSTFSNFFCWETARPIDAKFHLEPLWDVRNENLFKCLRSHNQDRIWCAYENIGSTRVPDAVYKVLRSPQDHRPLGSKEEEFWSFIRSWVDLDHFYDMVMLFPNAPAEVKAYTTLCATVFPIQL